MLLAFVLPCVLFVQVGLAEENSSEQILSRVEREANGAVACGVRVDRKAFGRGVGVMTKILRNLAAADPQLTLVGSSLRESSAFPIHFAERSLLPLLVAQQTIWFSLLADKVAELRRPHPRHLDWRATTMGRLIQAVAHSVRQELVLMSECEVTKAPYAPENFLGLTTMARDLSAMATDPRIFDELRAVADVSPGGSTYGEYRASMIVMLGILRGLNNDLDRGLPLPPPISLRSSSCPSNLFH